MGFWYCGVCEAILHIYRLSCCVLRGRCKTCSGRKRHVILKFVEDLDKLDTCVGLAMKQMRFAF